MRLGFTLDGISGKTSIRDAIGDTNTSVQPALDALAEAKVYTTGAPAELGHASGGILAVTFKSGTNELHGSFEDRWTNNVMTHRGYLQQGALIYPLTYHQALASISGPVVLPKIYNGRNKTFFLFAFGRHHEKGDEPQTGTVPDLNMLGGDFSLPQATGGGYPIYDPKSMRSVRRHLDLRTHSRTYRIPKTSFDQVAVNFLAMNPWQAPNNTGTYSRTGPSNNFIGQTLYRSYRSRYDTKFDQQISPNNKFFVRNSWNRHRQPAARILVYINDRLLDPTTGPGRPNPIDQQNWAFADYHTFTPTLMNELRLGFGRRVSHHQPAHGGSGLGAEAGHPQRGAGELPQLWPVRHRPRRFHADHQRGRHLPGQRDQAVRQACDQVRL